MFLEMLLDLQLNLNKTQREEKEAIEAAIEAAKAAITGEAADPATLSADLEAKEKSLVDLMTSFEVRDLCFLFPVRVYL
jgi:hypothetical protein